MMAICHNSKLGISESDFYLLNFLNAVFRAEFKEPSYEIYTRIYYFPDSDLYVKLFTSDRKSAIEKKDRWLAWGTVEIFADDRSVYDYLLEVGHPELAPAVLQNMFKHSEKEE
ncbi:hypothetical protein V7O61_02440 [Methanolobus sp. WCC1]|uniref:hypothetical protein n=1 Tax=unclassified Methanolobus TaxID=2629569 RepID=UPI00324ADD4C